MFRVIFPAAGLVFSSLARMEAAAGTGSPAEALPGGGQVVVAMRYLQIEGTSHSHLYLFGRDGKLVRQLTKSDAGQDADPVFAPDGKSVLYVRVTGPGDNPVEEWRLVSVEGGNDRAVAEPPAWREAQAKPVLFFGRGSAEGAGQSDFTSKAGEVTFSLKSGETLTLKDDPAKRNSEEMDWFPKIAWFRGTGKEPEVNLAKFPLFAPKRANGEKEFWAAPLPRGVVPVELLPEKTATDPDAFPENLLINGNSPFLEYPPLKAAFFTRHLGSTDKERLTVADLQNQKKYELAPNGGAVAILPGLPAFACVCSQLYLPLGDGRTVDCSYLDLWEPGKEGLRRIRFAEAKVGVFYGASLRLLTKDATAVFHLPGFQN